MNGDGYGEFIISSTVADVVDGTNTYVEAGKVYVYSGVDGSVMYQYDGVKGAYKFGYPVYTLGDVNGDGRPDFIVGNLGFDPTNPPLTDAGAANIYSGADGTLLCRFDGADHSDGFGRFLCLAGDVDGDGDPDVVVGSREADPAGVTDAGIAYILFTLLDTDGDDIEDHWERRHFGSTTNADRTTNHDTDALPDWMEFESGTDPTNSADYLCISGFGISPTDSNQFVLSWQSVSGRFYSLLATTNLTSPWNSPLDRMPGSGAVMSTNTDALGAGRFFRLGAEHH
jgi:hypothetical protein